jgi:hypothetical protein
MKVFGIGLPRTGTTTLLYACRELGYRGKTYNAMEFFQCCEHGQKSYAVQKLKKFIKRNSIFQDLPFPQLALALPLEYPDARYILTTRKDEATWFQSLYKNAYEKEHQLYILYLRKHIYGHHMPTADNMESFVKKYMDHNHRIREYFKAHPELKFIELCWENGECWEKLCHFLGKQVPDTPFPHKNKSK